MLDAILPEVASGHYSTQDFKSKLIEFGYKDIMIKEATNIHYCFKMGMNVIGWEVSN